LAEKKDQTDSKRVWWFFRNEWSGRKKQKTRNNQNGVTGLGLLFALSGGWGGGRGKICGYFIRRASFQEEGKQKRKA